MQRKVYQYWRRKKSSKETLSATTSKVQITVSDVGAQTIAQSGPLTGGGSWDTGPTCKRL